MKRILFILSLLISVCASAQIGDVLPAKPNPPRLVNDFAGLISDSEERMLESKLVAYDDSTSNQVAIVIVESLEGYEANEYAVELGRKWGVGGSQFNNGIVILISTGGGAGNRDAYIATGYGLEGAVPDVIAKTIVDHELIPYFKNGEYYRGLNNTVDALIKAAAGEYSRSVPNRSNRSKSDIPGWAMGLIVIIIIILAIVRGSGPGGTYMSGRGYRGWGGGGWMSGGGWSGGSSGGGGGFGGFGGGSFGGGGAGGKW